MKTVLLLLLFTIEAHAQYSKRGGVIQCLALAQPVNWYPENNNSPKTIHNQFVYITLFPNKIIVTDDDFNEKLKIHYEQMGTIGEYYLYAQDEKNFFIINKDMKACGYTLNGHTIFTAAIDPIKTLTLINALELQKNDSNSKDNTKEQSHLYIPVKYKEVITEQNSNHSTIPKIEYFIIHANHDITIKEKDDIEKTYRKIKVFNSPKGDIIKTDKGLIITYRKSDSDIIYIDNGLLLRYPIDANKNMKK